MSLCVCVCWIGARDRRNCLSIYSLTLSVTSHQCPFLHVISGHGLPGVRLFHLLWLSARNPWICEARQIVPLRLTMLPMRHTLKRHDKNKTVGKSWAFLLTEMVESMKKVADMDVELTVEERNLLSVAYKNVIGARRASWRIISSIEQREENKGGEEKLKMIREYRQKVKHSRQAQA